MDTPLGEEEVGDVDLSTSTSPKPPPKPQKRRRGEGRNNAEEGPAALATGALVAEADAAYRDNQLDRARALLNEVLHLGGQNSWAAHKLGLVEMRDGNLDEAAEWFLEALKADPDNWDAWLNLAVSRRVREGITPNLPDLLRFAENATEPIRPGHARTLGEIADIVFEQGDRAAAGTIYQALARLSSVAIRPLRWAESLLALGEADSARRLLEPEFVADRLDSWGIAAYAVACIQTDQFEDADIAFERLDQLGDYNDFFDEQRLQRFYRSGDFYSARNWITRNASRRTPHANDARWFEYHINRKDVGGALQTIESGRVPITLGNRHLFVQFCYMLLDSNDIKTAAETIALLSQEAVLDPGVLALRFYYLFRVQDWFAADDLMCSLPRELLDQNLPLRVKRFELATFLGRTEEARRELAGLGEPAELPAPFIPAVMRFFAEEKRWDEVVNLGAALLNSNFVYESAGDILFRASRKSRRHAEVISAIEAVPSWTTTRSLKKLRAMLLEDSSEGEAAIIELLGDPHVTEFAWAKSRLIHKNDATRGTTTVLRAAHKTEEVIFLATNGTYLCGTAVAIYSLLKSNRNLPGQAGIYVVVDDDAVGFAEQPLQALSLSFGAAITVVPASEIVPSDAQLSADYGVFTSGHTLAASAYYRIFFADYARKKLDQRRGLYLDSDTIVMGSVINILRADLGGAALSARPESDRPEVREAASIKGMDPAGYFNSGVLLFDFEAPDFEECIARTVAALYDHATRLLFHDQCALNIGFMHRVKHLDPRYNWFSDAKADPHSTTAEIIHFLDRPKPWDVAYDGPGSAFWFSYWREFAGIIGGQPALTLLRLAQV